MPFADAQHSHPEVSVPNGERISVPPDTVRHSLENEFEPEPNCNNPSEAPPAPAADDTDDLDSIHERHARQVGAIGRERNELARRLTELSGELAEARKDHAEELERTRLDRDEIIEEKEALALQLSHTRDQRREQTEAFASERAQLIAERDQSTAQLAELRGRHQGEMEGLSRAHDELATALARERELRHREVTALTAQNSSLSCERSDLSADLDRTRERRQAEVDALTAERDALRSERDALATETARAREQHKAKLAEFGVQHDAMVRERFRVSSEFSTFREGQAAATAALTAERDQLRSEQADLRAHLAVIKENHRMDLDELRRERAAVIKEADEIHEVLNADRLAWTKQIEFFTAERETLTRERDEALAELTRERQAENRQVELRTQECGNLLEQRAEMLGQIEELRAAEQRQNALFHEERKILCEERDHAAAKLALSMEALGEERLTLLQQKTDAEARLGAAKKEHAETVQSLENARVAVAGERDAARRELAVFQDAQAREETLFGAIATRKHELASTTVREGLRMKCAAKDATLTRDVEIRMIHGGGTSDERRAELIEEARHLARLQHPNIPPIYEAGFDESGQVFYTTRAVAGMSLRDVLNELERGKTSSLLHFSLRRLLSVFHRVCDTIAYAHSRDVAHGDLKPEHVILGEFGEVFVVGWHLPRAATADGEPVPAFQPREDITALGRILYEMTNLLHPPQEDETQPAVFHGKKAAVRAWAGDKDVSALASIAKRALDPKVAGRFYSVRELQMQVDAFKDSFDDPSRVTLKTILRQWVYLHRTALIVAGIVIVVALAAGFWLTMQPTPHGGGQPPSFQTSDRLELLRPPPQR